MLRLNAGLFIALLVIAFAGSVNHLQVEQSFAGDAIIKGKAAAVIESQYQEELPLKDWLVSAWAAFRFQVFNEGREGVVTGRENWLFTKEEYDWPLDVERNIAGNIDYIATVEQQLKAKNIEMILVLLPEKVSIQSSFVTKPSEHVSAGLYEQVVSRLQARGIRVVQASEAMASGQAQMFLKTDTHWTPEGAKTVADFIANENSSFAGSDEFKAELESSELYRGDLLNYIPVEPYFTTMGPAPDRLNRYVVEQINQADVGLFGDVSIDLALVGTSYSANPNWHFADFLKVALHRDLANYAEEGLGPLRPMTAFLSSDPFINGEITQVIWEIPVRFLVQPLTDEIE